MAKKKAADKSAQITFKCSDELKASLEDLAHLSRRDVSAILNELCAEYVKANRTRITSFRRQAAQPLKMPTFAPMKREVPAQIDSSDKGGETA